MKSSAYSSFFNETGSRESFAIDEVESRRPSLEYTGGLTVPSLSESAFLVTIATELKLCFR